MFFVRWHSFLLSSFILHNLKSFSSFAYKKLYATSTVLNFSLKYHKIMFYLVQFQFFSGPLISYLKDGTKLNQDGLILQFQSNLKSNKSFLIHIGTKAPTILGSKLPTFAPTQENLIFKQPKHIFFEKRLMSAYRLGGGCNG